ncbi:MAG: nucleotide excision repair endonuclease [Calditrichaeota bacterium]|nr:MAG: nucleotide excision repair endonuclease [Calditrichota bacterium]
MSVSRTAAEIWGARWISGSVSDSFVLKSPSLAARSFAGLPIIMDGIGRQLTTLRSLLPYASHLDFPVYLLTKLLDRWYPGCTLQRESDISALLGLTFYEDESPKIIFNRFVEQCLFAVQRLREQGINSLAELDTFYYGPLWQMDFSPYAFDADFVRQLPTTPGVYVMKDCEERIIYIGKAVDLNRRIRSYFSVESQADPKLQQIHRRLYSLTIQQTGSELEALLLEQQMIDAHQPPINRQRSVHSRSHRQKERFERILILPHIDPAWATLLFYIPGRLINVQICQRSPTDHVVLHEWITRAFFTMEESDIAAGEEEILISWLTRNHQVRSIDMRRVATAEEVLRLLVDHLSGLEAHSVIQV